MVRGLLVTARWPALPRRKSIETFHRVQLSCVEKSCLVSASVTAMPGYHTSGQVTTSTSAKPALHGVFGQQQVTTMFYYAVSIFSVHPFRACELSQIFEVKIMPSAVIVGQGGGTTSSLETMTRELATAVIQGHYCADARGPIKYMTYG